MPLMGDHTRAQFFGRGHRSDSILLRPQADRDGNLDGDTAQVEEFRQQFGGSAAVRGRVFQAATAQSASGRRCVRVESAPAMPHRR